MKKVKVKQLKQNPTIIEIRPLNVITVSSYAQHMRAGAEFPTIITNKKLMIVSGHHRHSAYLQEYGEDHEIEVDVRSFKSEADMIEVAVEENVRHGLPLDGISRKRAIVKLSKLGRTAEQLARLFGLSIKRVEVISGETVIVRGQPMPVKRGMETMHGKNVSVKQYNEHIKHDCGVPVLQYVKQLTRWINNGWVDMEDVKNQSALEQLSAALNDLLAGNLVIAQK